MLWSHGNRKELNGAARLTIFALRPEDGGEKLDWVLVADENLATMRAYVVNGYGIATVQG